MKILTSTDILLCFLCLFFISSCAEFKNLFKTPEQIPPITVSDKVKAFSLITYYLDSHNFDIEDLDFRSGIVKTSFLSDNSGIIGFNSVRAKALFSYSETNELNLSFIKVQMEKTQIIDSEAVYSWEDTDLFTNDYIIARNRILNQLDSLQSDSTLLKTCMDNFLGQFKYNYVLLKSLTEVGRSVFIQEHLINRNYKWSLPLVDFRFNDNPQINKKYVALFRYDVTGEGNFRRLFRHNILIKAYTDNESLSYNAKHQIVNYEGILFNADQTFSGDNYHFDFYENDSLK